MGKKVWVKLFGHQNRRILVDSEATDGAVVGKNLFWPDGTVVSESQLRSILSGSGAASTGATIDQNLLNYILSNLGKGGGGSDYPLHKDEVTDPLTISDSFQYFVWQTLTVNNTLTVEDGGELIIFDRPLPELKNPDFTEDVDGNLTQIDYADGSVKVFTYNGAGDLQYVDLTRDGWTYRKEFVYSGDSLDYVDEYYV